MPTGHALVGLFMLALAVSGYVHFAIHGLTLDSDWWDGVLSRILGGAIGLMVVPAVVIIPWRLIQKLRGTVSNTPISVGGFLFVILAGMWLLGAG